MLYQKKSEQPCPRCLCPDAVRVVDEFDGGQIETFDCPECQKNRNRE